MHKISLSSWNSLSTSVIQISHQDGENEEESYQNLGFNVSPLRGITWEELETHGERIRKNIMEEKKSDQTRIMCSIWG